MASSNSHEHKVNSGGEESGADSELDLYRTVVAAKITRMYCGGPGKQNVR